MLAGVGGYFFFFCKYSLIILTVSCHLLCSCFTWFVNNMQMWQFLYSGQMVLWRSNVHKIPAWISVELIVLQFVVVQWCVFELVNVG